MSNGLAKDVNALGRNYQIAHGSGQMRAQSISIQLSENERCNAGCLFCISRTTPGTSPEAPRRRSDAKVCDLGRLRVGLNYARTLGATHAVLTGRADPTQEDPAYLLQVIAACREYLPLVDMHTNGFLFQTGRPLHKVGLLERMVDAGLTMITFSVASFFESTNTMLMGIKQNPADLIRQAVDLGLLVRCSVVVNHEGIDDLEWLMEYIHSAGNLGAHMVVVREVWVPEVYGDWNRDVFAWNNANKVPIRPILHGFRVRSESGIPTRSLKIREGTPLPWGTPVFLVDGFSNPSHGVNVTFALCEEANVGSVIKSIVHKPNGHGYRNWDHNGDILY